MNNSNKNAKLGAFLGVYTPTILTILGVIMYMRSGWLVGHLGLYRSVLIVVFANVITLITTLSFSSVATNIRVGVGGAYYIVSRSLGLEIGGAIGLPLFLSQAFSITLYSFGLAEVLHLVVPWIPVQAATFAIIIIVGWLSYKGAETALKSQLPLMALVGISIFALAYGAFSISSGAAIPEGDVSGEVGFWEGFSVFFPAVTGVMAGLGLSGDLREPQKAIPKGAISATLTGFVIYLAIPFLLLMGADVATLRGDTMVWSKIAPLGALLVIPGLLGAIFSSAVGSMLGAPRTLEALSEDHITISSIRKLATGEKGKKTGFFFSMAIALGAVFIGDLNHVAAVVTMFFLTVYGTVNIVAAVESIIEEPSWRPRFRMPWIVYLLGGLGCICVMFLINPAASIIAIVIEFMLYLLLMKREHTSKWGDARRGIYEALIKRTLKALERHPMGSRNWRPHLLVFVNNPSERLDIIRFGNWFSQMSGIVTVSQLVVGDLLDENLDVEGLRKSMKDIFEKEGLSLFPEVDVVKNFVDGVTDVAQANGMTAIESNTIMICWPDERENIANFLRVMRRLDRIKKSLIIGKIQPRYLFPREGVKRTIHVWWGGLQRNGDLMLLLAHLLTRNPAWRNAEIKVLSIASNEMARDKTESTLRSIIPETRIKATPVVLVKPPDKTVKELIHEWSREADVVFFGLNTPDYGKEEDYTKQLEELAGELPCVFFVKNSSLFVGGLLESDGEAVKVL